MESFIWEDGGIKSDASGAIGSKEGCEEACEDNCEDDCKSTRGLLGLPPLLIEVANRLPLLPAVRVSPKGALDALEEARKGIRNATIILYTLGNSPSRDSDGEYSIYSPVVEW